MTNEYNVDAAIEELTSPSTFNLKAALEKKTSPVESTNIYLDAESMHNANLLTDEVIELESELNTYKQTRIKERRVLETQRDLLSAEEQGGIVDDPEKAEVEAELAKHDKASKAGAAKREKAIKAKNAEVEKLIQAVRDSVLKFKLRGIISRQSELIVAKWSKNIKTPARGDYKNETDWQADFEAATMRRNRAIVVDQLATTIVSVTGADGVEHGGAWSFEQTAELWDVLEESERRKLSSLSGNLTFANTLFDRVATEDADFLSNA